MKDKVIKHRKMIWITWEIQRRNMEIVKSFGGVQLYQFDVKASRPKRYLLLGIKTLRIICNERPEIIFAQNPSIVLTVLVLLFKNIFRYRVVVDLHTKYIKFDGFMAVIAEYLEKYALKNADMTIVTNDALLKEIKKINARGCVLPDKVPDLLIKQSKRLRGERNVVFVCTFSSDEPVEEVLKAATLIDPDIYIYITGNLKNAKKSIIDTVPPNVVFTDFLPEEDYIQLLCSADIILVLTTEENCLVCGAYEAVSLEKPLITSNKVALKDYFDLGTLYTDNTSKSIAEKINFGLENSEKLIEEVRVLKEQKEKSWEKLKNDALNIIRSLN